MTNIQKYREKNNLSKNKLAKELKVSRSIIINWEQKKRQPCIDNAIKLGLFFNVSPLEFLTTLNIKINLKPFKCQKADWSRHQMVLDLNHDEQDQ